MNATRISLGLRINAGVLLASSRAYLRWNREEPWEEFVQCQVRANETYSEEKC